MKPELLEINKVLPNYSDTRSLYKKYGQLNFPLLRKEGLLVFEKDEAEDIKLR